MAGKGRVYAAMEKSWKGGIRMAVKTFCDICGERIFPAEHRWYGKYKLKQLHACWEDLWWEKVEAHQECVDALCEAIKERRNKDDR